MQSPFVTGSTKLAGGLLISGSVLGLVGNALHPHVANADAAAVVRSIADNSLWVPIHLTIMLAILMVVGGLVGLAAELQETPGRDLARLGVGAALIGSTLATVSTSIDGFAMKALATTAEMATGDAGMPLRVATATQSVDFAIWTMGMLVFFGISFGCLGAAVLTSRRMAAAYGWTPIIGAIGATIAALLQIAFVGPVQAAESLFLGSSLVLTIWAFAVGVQMWRGRFSAEDLESHPSVGATRNAI